jgi:hypothetical protein
MYIVENIPREEMSRVYFQRLFIEIKCKLIYTTIFYY